MERTGAKKQRAMSVSGETVEAKAGTGSPRRAARLGAVQALYQIDVTGITPDGVLLEFLQHRLEDDLEGLRLGDIDRQLFADVVRGVSAEAESLDDMLSAVLAEDWPIERLERLLKVILRAGSYELAHREKVPARAVISEYVELAHGFFDDREAGMANGVLDRLARVLRAEEFDDADSLSQLSGLR